jgi:hypothetical protein
MIGWTCGTNPFFASNFIHQQKNGLRFWPE